MQVAISPAGDSALLLRFGAAINVELFEIVRAARVALAPLTELIDVAPGYASLLLTFDPCVTTPAALGARVQKLLAAAAGPQAAVAPPRTVEIPVFYDPSVAPDLLPLAAEKGLSVAALVARHTAVTYRCHMLGFRPGFPFLGGLDPGLATPRLATPRLAVPAGSVAIAGQQTGIYPNAGPGGWRIIGRTALVLFDPARARPALIEAGDEVRFVAIDAAAFAEATKAR